MTHNIDVTNAHTYPVNTGSVRDDDTRVFTQEDLSRFAHSSEPRTRATDDDGLPYGKFDPRRALYSPYPLGARAYGSLIWAIFGCAVLHYTVQGNFFFELIYSWGFSTALMPTMFMNIKHNRLILSTLKWVAIFILLYIVGAALVRSYI